MLGKNLTPVVCLEKKSIHLGQIIHTPSKVKWSAPYNTCDSVHVAKIFSILEHLKTWSKRF